MSLTILPNSGQNLDETRDPIRINFSTINTGFALNHVELTAGDPNSGKHKFVTFVQQAAAPVFVGTDDGMWAAQAPTLAITGSELWLKKFYDSGTLDFNIPFTASFISNTAIGSITDDIDGWTCLPSGLIIKWGVSPSNPPLSGIHVFPTGPNIPPFTNCFTVIPLVSTAIATQANYLYVTAITPLQFTVNYTGVTIRYLAIGW